MESRASEKDLGLLVVDERWEMNQQHPLRPGSYGYHGLHQERWFCLLSGETLPGVLHPALQSQYRKNFDSSERIQRSASGCKRRAKMIRGMEYFSNKEGLTELNLFSLEERRIQCDLIVVFQHQNWAYKKNGGRLFARACSDKTRREWVQTEIGMV